MTKMKIKRAYKDTPKRKYGNGGFDADTLAPMINSSADMVLPGLGKALAAEQSLGNAIAEPFRNDLGTIGDYDPVTGQYKGDIGSGLALRFRQGLNPLSGVQAMSDVSNNGGNVVESLLAGFIPRMGEKFKTEAAFKARQEAQKKRQNELAIIKGQQDAADLKSYNTHGDYGTSVYAAEGGLAPIAPDGYEVKGPKHAQGGVDLGSAEVEGGELVRPQPDGTMQIDSKQLGTADANKPLLERKNVLAKELEGLKIGVAQATKMKDLAKNSYSQATVERNIQKLDIQVKQVTGELAQIENQIQSNFQQQQQVNGNNGGEQSQQFARGADWDPNDPTNYPLTGTEEELFYNTRDLSLPINTRLGNIYSGLDNNQVKQITGEWNNPLAPISSGATSMIENMFPKGQNYTPVYSRNRSIKDANVKEAFIRNPNINTLPSNMGYEDLYADVLTNSGLTDKQLIELLGNKKLAVPFKNAEDLYQFKQKLLNSDGTYKPISEIYKSFGKEYDGTSTTSPQLANTDDNLTKIESKSTIENPTLSPISINGKGLSDLTQEDISGKTNSMDLNKLGQIGEKIVPYIDIVGNKILNDRLRKKEIPRPNMLVAPNYNTDYNINPELARISNETNSFNYGVSNSTGSGAVAGAYKLASLKNKLDATGQLLTKEQQYELTANAGLARETNQIANANIAQLNQYDKEKFSKEMQTDYVNPSKNLAKLEDNLQKEISQDRLDKFQHEQLAMMQAQFPKQVIASAISIGNSNDPAVRRKLGQYLNTPDIHEAAFSQFKTTDLAMDEMKNLSKKYKTNGEFITADDYVLTFKNGELISKTKRETK